MNEWIIRRNIHRDISLLATGSCSVHPAVLCRHHLRQVEPQLPSTLLPKAKMTGKGGGGGGGLSWAEYTTHIYPLCTRKDCRRNVSRKLNMKWLSPLTGWVFRCGSYNYSYVVIAFYEFLLTTQGLFRKANKGINQQMYYCDLGVIVE